MEGRIIVFYNALYGTCSYELQWHKSRILNLKLEPDILIQYNRICMNILMCMSKTEQYHLRRMYSLQNRYNSKIKGTVPISFFIGCDLFCDSNGF